MSAPEMTEASAEAREATLPERRTEAGPGRWRAARRALTRSVLPPLVVLAVLVAVWWWYATFFGGALFPGPGEAARGFWTTATSGDVWAHTAKSWRSFAIGYCVSAVLGTAIGILMGTNRWIDNVFGVYLDIAIVTPMIVMLPIVLIALGITAVSEVVVIVFFAIPYVIMPVRNGVRGLPSLWFDLSRMLCASRRQTWRYVLLPGARRPIVDGLRLGLAHALSGMMIVELTLVAIGIGQVVLNYQAQFEFGDMFGYLFLVMLQVVIALTLVNRLYESSRKEAR